MIPIRCKRRGIPRNFCARSLIFVPDRIFSAASFVCVADWLSPFTVFFRNGVLFMCTRQSLPGATAKEPENYFASQRWIRQLPDREQQRAKSIMGKTFSPGRLI